IGAKRLAQLRLPGEHVLKHLPDQAGIDVGVIEPLREAMADGLLQPLVAQHGGEDEPAEGRLGVHGLLGFAAHLSPDRVDLGDLALGLEPGRRCHHRSPARFDVVGWPIYPALTSARSLVNVPAARPDLPGHRAGRPLLMFGADEGTWDPARQQTRPRAPREYELAV